MSTRYEVREFTADLADAAGELLAERHRRQRLTVPALNPDFEQPQVAAQRVAELAAAEDASGAAVFVGERIVGYILGAPKADPTWGPNVWVQDGGCAGSDPEAIRHAFAAAGAAWVEAGRTRHYAIVPAQDDTLLSAWYSLGFGQQHVHGVREPVAADFQPFSTAELVIRRAVREDLPVLAELDLVNPRHALGSPDFAELTIPSYEETLAEFEADFDDPRFTTLVAVHNGRVVGYATACSLELSGTNTVMLRPRSSGFLGYAAVLPDARGLGAGRALGEAVLAWSRDEGYEWVAADWRSANIQASRSWTGIGFKPTFLRLHRRIR